MAKARYLLQERNYRLRTDGRRIMAYYSRISDKDEESIRLLKTIAEMDIEDFPPHILQQIKNTLENCHQDISTIHHYNHDEDIKVSTYNSDEENTSSEEDENIEIPEPMDIEPTDPYGKRKIESDNQTYDYVRSLNKDFEIDKNTVRIFGNRTENIATNEVKPEYPGETSNQPVQ
ncbi:hypothetical protein Gotur_032881 [Gossypium turneri]